MGRFLTQKLSTAEASCDDVLYLSFPTITTVRNKVTVSSQNKALFRVFSFGLANSAAKQLCGGLVVVGRPLLLGQRARLLLLLLADAGLDHGGVDACIEGLEYLLSRKNKRAMAL